MGCVPNVASHISATNKLHALIISDGEQDLFTTPSRNLGCSAEFKVCERAICCSAINRTATLLRIVESRKALIDSGLMYLAHSWNLNSSS